MAGVSSRWKVWGAVLWLLIAVAGGAAQGQQKATVQPIQPVSRAVINFSELAAQEALRPPAPRAPRAIHDIPEARPRPVPAYAFKARDLAIEGQALTPSAPRPMVASPSPTANFQGMPDDNTTIPPDTDGAVGPNHLVVHLNNGVLIQHRDGSKISKVSLPTFWAVDPGTDIFDPRVLYDPYGNRWLMAAVCCSNTQASMVYVAASATSDPTGTWFIYRFAGDANSTKSTWADYPTMGLNKAWVSVSFNVIKFNADVSSGATILYFSKADLYNNAPTPYAQRTTASDGGTMVPAVTYDNNISTLYFVETWNGNAAPGPGQPAQGFLRMSQLTGTQGSESVQVGSQFVAGAPWDSNEVDAPQLGTTYKVDNGDDRTLTVMYRNGSLWVTQNVFLPVKTPSAPTHTASQWWQFLPNATVQQFGRVEDTTAAYFYAYPSLAVNQYGDVLMGYTCFSASIYPSACYSFRGNADAAGTMRDNILYKPGESFYYKPFSGTANRWGDFSATVVDPVNDTDLWTLQEYAGPVAFEATPIQSPYGDSWGTWWAYLVVPPPTRKRLVQVTSE